MDHHRAGPERDDPPAPGGILARGGRIEIYTSHWRKGELADLADAVIVGVSRGTPRRPPGYRFRVMRQLAPSRETFALEDREAFERAYLVQLDALGVRTILDRLERVADGRPVVLVCWERPGAEYCHRWTLSGYLEREVGIVVPELAFGDLLLRPDAPQTRLF